MTVKCNQKDIKKIAKLMFGRRVTVDFGTSPYNRARTVRISGNGYDLEIVGDRSESYHIIGEKMLALTKAIGDKLFENVEKAKEKAS